MTGRQGRGHSRYVRAKANQRAKRADCWICGEPIDYEAESRPSNPDSYTVDHVVPWSKDPTLRYEPTNLRSAHWKCNDARGADDLPPELGYTSRAW